MTILLTEKLLDICGAAYVLTEASDIEPYAADWKRSSRGTPLCVVRPADRQAVAACRSHGASIVPQGGNTGLAAGATPGEDADEVVLSLTRMKAIRALDPVAMTGEVEAEAILQVVKEESEKHGRLLPVSLAAKGSATIGGIVSTNVGGINVLRYGMTRALVLGLEVVLLEGTIVDSLRHLRKDNAGYDWKQIFIGAEGTLGIVTAAVLRLVTMPSKTVTVLLSVRDIETALQLFALAQDTVGGAISAFELISATSINLVERHAGLKSPIAAGDWYLLIEAASSLSALEPAMKKLLSDAFEQGLALDGVVASSRQQAQALWALREHVTEVEAREGRGLKHDISVPLQAIAGFLAEVGAAVGAISPGVGFIFGHLSDGNLHYNVLLNGATNADAVNRVVHDAVVNHRGSAEHGIGQHRLSEWLRTKPESEQRRSRAIKQAIDPEGLFNPGKLLPKQAKGDAV